MAFVGSNFVNPPIIDGRVEGHGKYVFKDGNYYVGEFLDGRFHGNGTLYFIEDGMRYKGKWNEGVAVEGSFYFKDELVFNPQLEQWDYCSESDRRFASERLEGLLPANASRISDTSPPKTIPNGTFDVVDGYFDPKDGWVYTYEGKKLRQPELEECNWIIKFCRRQKSSC